MGETHLTTQTKWGGAVVLVIVLGLSALAAQAGEVTQKGRDTYVCSDQTFVEVGDVPDHFVVVFNCQGISSTEGGEAGILKNLGIGDYTAGKGTEKVYYEVTYDDGSVVRGNGEGTSTPDEGGETSTSKGTYQITSGTGRFAGIKGSGSYTCKGYGDKGYCDWTETYTVP